MRKLNPFFLFFIFFFSVIFVFSIDNVLSVSTEELVTWEAFNVGQYTGSDEIIEFENASESTAGFSIHNADRWGDGSLSLRLNGGTTGYINVTKIYSYMNSFYIYISVNFKETNPTQKNIDIYFYNNSIEVLYLRVVDDINTGSESIGYYDFDGNYNELELGATFDIGTNDRFFKISHISGNLMNYSLYNESSIFVSGYDDSSRSNGDWLYFDSIKTVGNSDTVMYIDDIILESVTGGGYGDDEISEYDYKSFGCTCGNTVYHAFTSAQFIEQYFDIPISGLLKAYDIFLDINYINQYDITKYELYVNGHYQGQPDSITSLTTCARMRWLNIDVPLNNEKIVFELQSLDDVVPSLQFWHVSTTTSDCHGDGRGPFIVHNNIVFHGDGIRKIPPYPEGAYSLDICSQFHILLGDFETIVPIPDVTPFDDLEFSGNGYLGVHPEYGIENYYQNTSVFITYNIATLIYTSEMYIYYEGVETGHTQLFSPRRLDNLGDVLSFVPYNVGNYTVTIVRDNIEVANRSFYSSQNNFLYQIWTIPAITNVYDSYQVFYKYSNTEKDGLICVFSVEPDVLDINDEDDSTQSLYIDSTGVKSFLFTPSTFIRNFDLWRIFVEIQNDTYESVGLTHRHYTFKGGVENTLSVSCGDGGSYGINFFVGFTYAELTYTHVYTGGEVAIFLNNQKIRDIGDYNTGTIYYQISKELYCRASLRVFINDTWYLLANVTFNVYDERTSQIYDDPIKNIFDELFTEEQQFLLGMGIIIICIFMPIVLSYKLAFTKRKKDLYGTMINIPQFVYVIMAVVGLAVDIYLELLELWTIVLFVFVVASVIVYLVLGKLGIKEN